MSSRSVVRSVLQVGAAAASVYALKGVLQRADERLENKGIARGKRVVIVGGGFAGAAVAQELARLLPDADNGEIVLVDEDNFLLFTPMLTEAAGGAIETSHIASPLRSLGSRVRFLQGRVLSLDLAARTLEVKPGSGSTSGDAMHLQADQLVLALGSVTNTHGTPGVDQNGLGMKTLPDARRVFQRLSANLEAAHAEQDEERRRSLLTFVVAGGGYTGVETMAALNDFVRESVRSLPGLQDGDVRTLLVTPEDRLLPELSAELAHYAADQLQKAGVEIRYNVSVTGATEDAVRLTGGDTIATRTLVWAAGVTPNPLIASLPAAKGKHHGLLVDSSCQVGGFPGVWALGDCAEIPQPNGKGAYAPTAQNATREGRQVAQNILATLHGAPPEPFRYMPMGELALVGRHTGVARVFGVNFSGVLAWAMWRAVYLAKMPGMAQRGRVLSDWVLDVLFGSVPVPLAAGSHAEEAPHPAAARPAGA